MQLPNLKIRLYGDPCLKKKSTPVKEVGASERILINALIDTMHQNKGIGLAAPQLGINQRIFVADVGDGPIAVVNPVIVKKSGSATLEEGCLSIPGISVEIKRPSKITVKYIDQNNKKVMREFSDLKARVILHETDHCNGKLILDYVNLTERKALVKQSEEYLKREKE